MKRAYNSNAESERIPAFLGHVVQIDMQKEKEVRTVAHKVCFKLMQFLSERHDRCRISWKDSDDGGGCPQNKHQNPSVLT